MIYKIVNLLMFAVMILFNYLANALPLNGKTTGELSAEYPNLFVPAGVTFSIWGVIYLMLLIFIVLQFFESYKSIVQGIGWIFALSCLLNAMWIVTWHYQLLSASLIVMLGLLLSLIVIGLRLQPITLGLAKGAFGVYLGWICIATIANFTALLVDFKWGGWGFSEQTWAIVLILVGVIIVSITLIRLQNPFIGLAVVWAFLGIVIKQKGLHPPIVITAIIGIVVVGVLTLWLFARGGLLTKA